ncbi:hypothetical protein D3C71_1874120 [compost metagenome]
MGEAYIQRIRFPFATSNRIRINNDQLPPRISVLDISQQFSTIVRGIIINHNNLISIFRIIKR